MSITSALTKGRAIGLVLVFALFGSLLAAPAATPSTDLVKVIIRTMEGASVASTIEDMGGTITGTMTAIDSVTAQVPASSIGRLEAHPSVISVTQDSSVDLSGGGWDNGKDVTNLAEVANVTQAGSAWDNGATGNGVTVALIDSGVTPVEGLATAGKIINGPDLSFDSQYAGMQYLDAYGHGTHMAGIIAGRASGVGQVYSHLAKKSFLGVAPDARILNVKVGAANGAVDVSQVLAGINWVIEHRNDNGMNVRVLNLSFGTNSSQAYTIDPLSYAVQVAWKNGIVVVVAAGNDSNGSALRSPATNPYVIAVGADATGGTTRTNDDYVPDWSNCGTLSRSVDVVAPGKTIASLRVPGSYADVNYPGARLDNNLFKGSGTSQAAAVVSGIATLVLDAHPEYTPDQVKRVITGTSKSLWGILSTCQGSGLVTAFQSVTSTSPGTAIQQVWAPATGLGSLEAARGSDHLADNGVALQGEIDIFGQPFSSPVWAGSTWSGSTWSGGTWNGSTWSGSTWSGSTWSGSTWSGSTWSGSTWSGSTWSGANWNGSTWSGGTWNGSTWSGSTWSGKNWTGLTWDHGKRIR
ncbi:MAG: S8 family serine peptidase [Acidimicrobiia bacterium]|nr:S8 family serine peptidase [Acidimicrobiia bacterium]